MSWNKKNVSDVCVLHLFADVFAGDIANEQTLMVETDMWDT